MARSTPKHHTQFTPILALFDLGERKRTVEEVEEVEEVTRQQQHDGFSISIHALTGLFDLGERKRTVEEVTRQRQHYGCFYFDPCLGLAFDHHFRHRAKPDTVVRSLGCPHTYIEHQADSQCSQSYHGMADGTPFSLHTACIDYGHGFESLGSVYTCVYNILRSNILLMKAYKNVIFAEEGSVSAVFTVSFATTRL